MIAQAEKNYTLNKECLSFNISFKPLVWNHQNEDFGELSAENGELIKNADIFMAADVVYDDLITLKFMNTLYKLLTLDATNMTKCCFIAGEKRVNFNTHDLKETDCAYNYFKASLLELDEYVDSGIGVMFRVTQLDCSHMTQFVANYERNDYLYIWKLEMFPEKKPCDI